MPGGQGIHNAALARPSKRVIIDEVMSIRGCGYQIAKSIVTLAEKPDGTFQKIGPSGSVARDMGLRRSMSQAEAKRVVDQAIERIRFADEGD